MKLNVGHKRLKFYDYKIKLRQLNITYTKNIVIIFV